MKTKIITLTIISLLILSVIGFIIPELATELAMGSEEEVTITIFDQEGRNMAEEGDQDIVQDEMRIEVREPKYFGLSHDVIAEAEGGSLTEELPSSSYYDIVVIWMGEEIYKENRKIDEDVTIHMDSTPSKMIEDWSREQLSTSSDLRDINTPYQEYQLGAGEDRNHVYIDLGGTRYGLPAIMEVDGEEHPFQFRNTEPGEYTDWTDDFLIWEDAYHYSASSSEKVGDNMMVLQWQYGYFDTGGAHIDRVVQGAGAGAVAGAIAGSIKPGIGTGIGAIAGAGVGAIGTAVATSVEPELARTDAEGGVSAITLVITPRYTVINSVVVDGTGSTVEFSLGTEDEDIWEQKAVSEDVLYEVELQGAGEDVTNIAIGSIPTVSEVDEFEYHDIKYTGDNDITYDDYPAVKSEDGVIGYYRVSDPDKAEYGIDDQDNYYFEHYDTDDSGIHWETTDINVDLDQNSRYDINLYMDWYSDEGHGQGTGDSSVELKVYDSSGTEVDSEQIMSIGSDEVKENDVVYDGNTWETHYKIGSEINLEKIHELSGIDEENATIEIDFNDMGERAYRKRLIDFDLEIIEQEMEDPEEDRQIFVDEVVDPATRLLREHIPVFQPKVGTGATVNREYTLVALDVRDLPDVTTAVDWATPDIHIYLTRFMLTSETGNWTETCYILSTDREEGFNDITFILHEGEKFHYNSDFHDYSAWTNPGQWSSVEDWSSVYYNGTKLNYPSPEDWGLGGWWDETRWDWNQWWDDIGPLVKLALIGIGLLIIGLIILIVAPWIIFGLIKALVFIFKQIANSTRKIVQTLRGEGGWS